MKSTHHLLVGLIPLLLAACALPPGGDTAIHHRAVTHGGVATVTKRYGQDGEAYIDMLWQADNNTGQPAAFSGIALNRIAGLQHHAAVAVGDRLHLAVTHLVTQKGSTTPRITQSRWTAADPGQAE